MDFSFLFIIYCIMMENEKTLEEEIHLLNIEDLMYILFIVGSFINIQTNEKVRNFKIQGVSLNDEIRDEYLFASFLILIVFIVFAVRNYKNLTKLKKGSNEYNLAEIRLLGSILLVIGQCMIIYYLYHTDTYSSSPI